MDIVVGDLELALCHSRRLARVGGDKTSDESSPWRVEEVELSNHCSGRDVQVVINGLSITDGSGCIVHRA